MHVLSLAAALLVQDGAAAQAPDEAAAAAPVSEFAVNLFDRLPDSLETWEPEGFEAAAAMQAFAMAGREDLIARFEPGAFTYGECPVLEGEALDTVTEAAREAQIVIVNEAHDQPFHRHVIEQIGLALSAEFDVFAAETFNYLRLMGEREPGALGWYDNEPVFARQVAALDEAGYRFVAYEIRAHQRDPVLEDRAERIALREEAQANNLIAEVLEDDPDARILVHVGYSHVLEAPQPRGEGEAPLTWFAARLKDKTGIDPLTISQTHCSPAAPEASVEAQEDDPPAEAGAEAEGEPGGADSDPPEPVVAPGALGLADGADAAPDGSVDLFLAHGPMTFTDHRPDWRRAAGDVAVAVPETLRAQDGPVIVEARAPDETLAHAPADRVLVYPGETPVLLLPQGEWVVTAWRADGQVGAAVEVAAR